MTYSNYNGRLWNGHRDKYCNKDYFSREEAYEESRYTAYRNQSLPEGYTAYNEHAESVYKYDQYEYDLAEPQIAHRSKQSFCKKMRSFCSDMGRLISFYKNRIQKI